MMSTKVFCDFCNTEITSKTQYSNNMSVSSVAPYFRTLGKKQVPICRGFYILIDGNPNKESFDVCRYCAIKAAEHFIHVIDDRPKAAEAI